MVIRDQVGRPVLATQGGMSPKYTEIYELGWELARTPIGIPENSTSRGLWEARGWKEFVDHMPDYKKPVVALLLENCRSKFGIMNETTRTSALGTFDKWIFPVIANMAENDVIDQMVSVQPMAGPVSQIVYMDIVTERRKGRIPAGAQFWRALQGATDRSDDSDELISNETGSNVIATNAASNTLEWLPLRPGTLQVVCDGNTATDDGNGAITASGGITGGTVNYVTGVVAITTSGIVDGEQAVYTYAYNSEGNATIQGLDVKLTSTPVTAKVIKFRTRWTEESDQNLQSMFNVKAEPVLLNAVTNGLQYQKHRQIIVDLRARADAGVVLWDANMPANTNYQTHKFSLIDAFQTASQYIYGATNMVKGNWILAGLQAVTVIVTLPQFTPAASKSTMQGLTYIGDLGDMKVFADPHFPINEWLVGYKGGNGEFLTTGFVLAEYQKLYTTPDVLLPDFVHQRGFATSYAKKMVNSKMYARGLILNSPTSFGTVIG